MNAGGSGAHSAFDGVMPVPESIQVSLSRMIACAGSESDAGFTPSKRLTAVPMARNSSKLPCSWMWVFRPTTSSAPMASASALTRPMAC